MKNQKIPILYKQIILLLGLLLLTNCEKSEDILIIEDYVNLDDFSVKEINIKDFLNSDTYQLVSKNVTISNRSNTSSTLTKSNKKIELEYVGTKVLISSVKGQKTYSVGIKDINDKNANYNLNLLIVENDFDSSTFLVKYPNDGSAITMHPINHSISYRTPTTDETPISDETSIGSGIKNARQQVLLL